MKYAVLFLLLAVCGAFAQNAGHTNLPPKSMFLSASVSPAGNPSITASMMPSMFDGTSGFERKSVIKAVGLSLLLPGMGELYAGEYGGGKYFTIAEAGLWLGWGGFTSYATWTQNDARAFATQHAALKPGEKDDQFYGNIGEFISVDAYNQSRLRLRLQYEVYDPQSSLTWQWDADNSREHYRAMRIQSDESFNYARFAVAAIVTNHIVSAINAGRLAARHNKSGSESSSYYFRSGVNAPTGVPDGVTLSVVRTF